MVSLLVHAVLGVAVIVWVTRSNRAIFRRTATGPVLSALEWLLYAVGAVSIAFGWYFNIRFVAEYAPDGLVTNPIWGDGSWAQYLHLMFANPAAGSAGADFTIANVVLLPLVTIVDGRRRGIAKPWLFFAATLFTSFTFGWAFYLATLERQRRLRLEQPAEPVPVGAASDTER